MGRNFAPLPLEAALQAAQALEVLEVALAEDPGTRVTTGLTS